jgi:uncharacterized protein
MLELLVLQPTPLCNLDCTYCYLPNRKSNARMSFEVVEAAVRAAVDSPFTGDQFTILWHAGEPTVLRPKWYLEAFERIERLTRGRLVVTHSFQTNGTRIDDAWLEIFKRRDVRVGVSYDGPAFLHDARRVRWDGSGTHAEVRRGMQRLKEAGVPFHVIAVVTGATLRNAAAFHEDVLSLGATQIGLNFEEQEGANAATSLDVHDVEAGAKQFFAGLLERVRVRTAQGLPTPRLREADSLGSLLLRGTRQHFERFGTQENEAFRIVSVAHDGSFSTWSPELLDQRKPDGTDFVLGNVLRDSFEAVHRSHRYRELDGEIRRGRVACATSCPYFEVCGGGSPSNKLAELGRLDGTQTRHCRITRQVLSEVVLEALESDLGVSARTAV